MSTVIRSLMVVAFSLAVIPAVVLAQQRPQPVPAQTTQQPPARPAIPAPAADTAEIKLDESTTLQEMTKMLEERKTLIQDAGKKATVDVKDPNEWAFDNKDQRYLKVRRPQ